MTTQDDQAKRRELPDPVEMLYIESPIITLTEFRKRIDTYLAAERERILKQMEAKVPEPNPREWASSDVQVAWTIGYETAIKDTKDAIAELQQRKEKL